MPRNLAHKSGLIHCGLEVEDLNGVYQSGLIHHGLEVKELNKAPKKNSSEVKETNKVIEISWTDNISIAPDDDLDANARSDKAYIETWIATHTTYIIH